MIDSRYETFQLKIGKNNKKRFVTYFILYWKEDGITL